MKPLPKLIAKALDHENVDVFSISLYQSRLEKALGLERLAQVWADIAIEEGADFTADDAMAYLLRAATMFRSADS